MEIINLMLWGKCTVKCFIEAMEDYILEFEHLERMLEKEKLLSQ